MNKPFVHLCLLFVLPVTLYSNRTFANPEKPLTGTQINALTVLGKTWGFLKYYHPNVAKGQHNWDSVLIAKVPVFLSANTIQDVSKCITTWLNELGPVAPCPACDNTLSGRFTYNLDTTWISHSGFTAEVTSKLQFILANRNQGYNHYASASYAKQLRPDNELSYYTKEFQFPSPAYRLLTLYRYWNIVNYFSPYKYITDKKWDVVLNEFIPVFYEVKDTLQYHISISRLIAALSDGHSAITRWSTLLRKFLGEYNYLPFGCSIVEGKAIVTLIMNDSLCKLQGIALNDVITSVDGETIEERINKYLPYEFNASNEDARLQGFCISLLFAGKTGDCAITRLMPDGKTEKLTVKRYTQEPPYAPPVLPTWQILPGNIGYINMGLLVKKEVNAVMDSLFGTRGIIIDLRHYPNSTWPLIAKRLTSKKYTWPRLSYPDLSYPGVYKFHPDVTGGGENAQPYKGKVIILVNAFSKSHAEFSAMGLQEATQTITIGSTTAGADGDPTDWIVFPGGLKTKFSGLGIYYPDGTCAQRTGVKIDIVCRPTIKGMQAGKDELLEKAVSVIEGK